MKQERQERTKKKQLPAFCVKKQEPFFTSTLKHSILNDLSIEKICG